jgi:hypothetical protein
MSLIRRLTTTGTTISTIMGYVIIGISVKEITTTSIFTMAVITWLTTGTISTIIA